MSEPLPARAPLTLYRGDTRVWTIMLESNTGTDVAPVWGPYSLTGHTVLAQVRTDKDRAAPVVVTFTTTVTDAANGTVSVALSSSQADTLGVDGAQLWWDFQTTRTADTFRRTWLAGAVAVRGDVSNV